MIIKTKKIKTVLYPGILLKLFLMFLYSNAMGIVTAQPNLDLKSEINGVTIFQDHTNPMLFYYQPGKLVLALKKNGVPDFQFLDMRYTGTKCYNDQGDKNFMSILQFGVEMKPIDSKLYKTLKNSLPRPYAKLQPLPLSHILTKLVMTNIADNKETQIAKEGNLEAAGKEAYSSSKSFWTKRNFVIRLNKFESQALVHQLQKNLLGISLDYSYFADFKRKQDFEASGTKELIESITESLKDEVENTENRTVKSDVLPIYVDLEKYPNALKQIDLNEQIPPAYAGLEVRCYDFSNEIRPDLYMKVVEIEAESVDRKRTIKVSTKFSKKHRDLSSKHIAFPYAVYVNSPMRYREISYNINGEKEVSEWTSKLECNSLIDITTPIEKQNSIVKNVEVFIDRKTLFSNSLTQIEVVFLCVFNGVLKTKVVSFMADGDLMDQAIKLVSDKNTDIYYKIRRSYTEKKTIAEPILLEEDYLFISDSGD